MNTQPLKKTLLTTSLIALFAVAGANAIEDAAEKVDRSYIDPITGETKQAVKLLSEMTDTEKALLSNEEYRALKDLEAKLNAEADKEAQANGE